MQSSVPVNIDGELDGDLRSGDLAIGNPGGNDYGTGGEFRASGDLGGFEFSAPGGGGSAGWMLHVVADPIDTRTGNKYHVQVDYQSRGAGSLKLARSYISIPSQDQSAKTVNFGLGWRTNYDRSLQYISVPSPQVNLHRANGVILTYTLSNGQWTTTAPGGVLTQVTGGWQYINNRNAVEYYDTNGRLLALSRYGQTTTLSYDANGRLSLVSNPFGRTLQFSYDASNRVAAVTLPGGSVLQYSYNANSSLTGVTFADGTTRQYLYENPGNPRLMTGIVDEAGRRYVTWGYDSAGRAISSEFAGGTNRLNIVYNANQTVTTDHRGVVRTRNFETRSGKQRLSELVTQQNGLNLVPKWKFNYDLSGTLTSLTTRRGEQRSYLFDSRGRVTSETRADGTSSAMTRTIQWHPQYRLPTQIVSNGVTTTNQVDSAGRVTQVSRTGSDGLTVTSTASYNAQGLVSQVTGPSGQVTSYTYDAAGNVATVTAPSGHVTRYLAYNAHGQPTQIQLPNGQLVDQSFDVRGRLISRSIAGRIMSFQYDAAGRTTRVTLPDGRFQAYSYDGARRLATVTNERNERLSLARDAGGEVTAAVVTDALGNVVAQRSRELDVLARTTAVVGAAGQRTQVGYDSIGDPTTITDPVSTSNLLSFDIFGRKTDHTVAGTETTRWRFDGNGRLNRITDPILVDATYAYDSLNRRTSESRSEFGTRTKQLNASSRATRQQESNGLNLTISRDTLQRVTGITAADGAAVSFGYAANTPTPLLASMTDPSGSTVWTYDGNNELQTKQQTVGAVSRALAVTRDALGRPTQVTYPSGAVVTYTWTNGLVSAVAVNGQTVLQQARYLPLGVAPIGWTWGNGLAQERSIDRDGQITAVTIGTARQTNTFDAAGRITRQLDTAAGGGILVERQFGYDPSGRLISYLSSVGDGQGFSYDKAGNRKQLSDASGSTNYDFDFAAPHRIVKLNPPGTGNRRDFTYDAAGNTTSDGLRGYTYNSFGRLSRVTIGTTMVDSTYNGQGLRVRKVANVNGTPTTTLFFYDDAGKLLGEYSGSGALIQETVWFAGMPVATIRPDGVYYVQADHLGTPRAVVRPSDNAVMWRWDSNPFGSTPAQEGTYGGGTFKYNLRFPGQYLDAETGLHYNVFRDYDPSIGRYMQADHIGLAGGLNTYAYGRSSPLRFSDRLGLFAGAVDAVAIGGGFLLLGCSMSSSCWSAISESAASLGNWIGSLTFAKPGNESRPTDAPTGTLPIDQSGLGRSDVHEVKGGVGAGPKDWVGIDPEGNVWTSNPDGTGVNHGPVDDYTPRPTGLCRGP